MCLNFPFFCVQIPIPSMLLRINFCFLFSLMGVKSKYLNLKLYGFLAPIIVFYLHKEFATKNLTEIFFETLFLPFIQVCWEMFL